MKFTLFFIIFLFVFVLINIYISKRFVSELSISDKAKSYFKVFLLINLFGILGYFLGRYYTAMPNWLYFLFSLPIGVLFLFFCTAVIYDIFKVLLYKMPISHSRREFFKKGLDIASIVAASSLSAKAVYEARNVEIEDVKIEIKGLAKPYTIVQLSDLHIGGLIDKEYVNNLVQRVNTLDADIVVITGDLVDIDIKHAKEALDKLKEIRSKYGTYFIVGNHEYFHNIDQIISYVKTLNIKVLENENVYIGEEKSGFNLAGVYDYFGYRVNHHIPDINKALENKKESPTILLAHQPRFVEQLSGGVDLMLSGHTHGGQIYPFRFLVKLQQPYIEGLHRYNSDVQVYVSRGTGFWGPPMRLGATSEITCIKLLPLLNEIK